MFEGSIAEKIKETIAGCCVKIVEKTWGKEFWVENNESYCLKLMEVFKECECSLHFHKIKKETFVGLIGTVELYIQEEGYKYLDPGTKFTLEPNTVHKFRGMGDNNLFLEVSTHHDDEDSYRV